MNTSNDVGNVREAVQKNVEEYLAIAPDEGETQTESREKTKRELQQKIEKVYALPLQTLMTQVSQALWHEAQKKIRQVYRDRQGFSAYRFNLRVIEVRKVLQQKSDLVFQSPTHLRSLYMQQVLKLVKRG